MTAHASGLTRMINSLEAAAGCEPAGGRWSDLLKMCRKGRITNAPACQVKPVGIRPASFKSKQPKGGEILKKFILTETTKEFFGITYTRSRLPGPSVVSKRASLAAGLRRKRPTLKAMLSLRRCLVHGNARVPAMLWSTATPRSPAMLWSTATLVSWQRSGLRQRSAPWQRFGSTATLGSTATPGLRQRSGLRQRLGLRQRSVPAMLGCKPVDTSHGFLRLVPRTEH